MKSAIALFLILAMSSGCATFVTRTGFGAKAVNDPHSSGGAYPAVWTDGEIIRSCGIDERDTPRITTPQMLFLSLGVMLDVPVSFAFDTIFLPWDLWQYSRDRKKDMETGKVSNNSAHATGKPAPDR